MGNLTKFGGSITDFNSAISSGGDLASSLMPSIGDIQGVSGRISSAIQSSGLPTGQVDLIPKLDIPGLSIPNITMPGANFDSLSGFESPDLSGTPTESGAPDIRIRISPQLSAIDQVYGPNDDSNILTPLRSTMGMMFPFTPSIEWNQQVEYTSTSLVHSNQDYMTYKNTPSTNIKISGEFVIQHHIEGQYMLAVMHFLRTVSKMYFGKASFNAPNTKENSLAGMPPPILILSGYGNFMFNNLPVIVKDHSYSFKPDVSYLDIKTAGGVARLPVVLTINVSLVVQNTPQKNRDEFDLDKFRTGDLMKGSNKGWI